MSRTRATVALLLFSGFLVVFAWDRPLFDIGYSAVSDRVYLFGTLDSVPGVNKDSPRGDN